MFQRQIKVGHFLRMDNSIIFQSAKNLLTALKAPQRRLRGTPARLLRRSHQRLSVPDAPKPFFAPMYQERFLIAQRERIPVVAMLRELWRPTEAAAFTSAGLSSRKKETDPRRWQACLQEIFSPGAHTMARNDNPRQETSPRAKRARKRTADETSQVEAAK
jgi:hypothetical protein